MPTLDTQLRAENQRLRAALQQIAGIENEMFGGDWDEIERARGVATAALGAPPVAFDQTPTTFIERFRAVLTLLAGGKAPSLEHCDMWLLNIQDGAVDPLQGWAAANVVVPWAQGIGVIDAARTLAEQPEEGVEHQSFEEAYPSLVAVTEASPAPATYREEDECDQCGFVDLSNSCRKCGHVNPRRDAEADAEWLARMHVAIKQFHTRDFGAGPVLHPDCISDALRKGLERGTAAALEATGELEANVRYLLDKCPHTVRDVSGERTGMRGREDLSGSLAITFLGMQSRLAGAGLPEADVRQLFKLAERWADARVESIRKASWGPEVRNAEDALWAYCRAFSGKDNLAKTEGVAS